jgi:hypothetical protein
MGITQARVTQTMNLAFLASVLQERVLMADSKSALETPREEQQLRALCAAPSWNRQAEMSTQWS